MQKHLNMSEYSSPIHFTVTPQKVLAFLAANIFIALFTAMILPGATFANSFIISLCIGICAATSMFFSANFFKFGRFSHQLILSIAAMIAGTVIGIGLAGVVLRTIAPGYVAALAVENKFKNATGNLVYALFFSSIMSYLFISQQKISDEKIKRLEVEKNAVATEIKLLQSQMEPHFLFNTLSNVLSLIDSDPEKAKRMLEFFTAFLRSSLVIARNQTITLAQELDVVKNYVEIFRIRMGERLRYSIETEQGLLDIRIPPLLIQPLVENAVMHGLEPSVHGGELIIRASRQGNCARIVVADSGMGINEMSQGNGIGIQNIKKRLDLLYNGRSRVVFEENEPSGVKAVIEIPL